MTSETEAPPRPSGTGATSPATGHRWRRPALTPWGVAMAVAVAGGLVLRFWATSALWLDEAQSVVVARLPLHELPAALRSDGAPPLYYLLLHGWTAVFGTGSFAVRSMSGLASVAALPLIYLMGRRLAGSGVGAAAMLLLASSPFAIRYATETRMYSLVVLLTLLGFEALAWVHRRPGWRSASAVALVTALLLYTHYWAMYLVAVVGIGLLWRWRRGPAKVASGWALAGACAGILAFLPWVPILLFQLRHTGTPWGNPASLAGLIGSVGLWAGGAKAAGRLTALLFFALAALGTFGRPAGRAMIVLDLRGRPRARLLAATTLATMLVALAAAMLTSSEYGARYTSVVFAPFVVLLGFGLSAFADLRVRRTVLSTAVVLGFVSSVPLVTVWRTQAGQVAAALAARAAPGDVVAFCPDQLGPGVARLAPRGLDSLVYPTGASPERVNWVDYAARNAASSPAEFARRLEVRAGARGIWLVYAGEYNTLEAKCPELVRILARSRPHPEVVVPTRLRTAERERLLYFRAP